MEQVALDLERLGRDQIFAPHEIFSDQVMERPELADAGVHAPLFERRVPALANDRLHLRQFSPRIGHGNSGKCPNPDCAWILFAPPTKPREERLNAARLEKDREARAKRLLNPFGRRPDVLEVRLPSFIGLGDCGAGFTAASGSGARGLTVVGIWCRSETRYETRKARMGVSRDERPRIIIAILCKLRRDTLGRDRLDFRSL
jgi:hypothetical protein